MDPKAEQVPLVALTPAPWNPRTIKDDRFQNLCASLKADPGFLQLRPILATADGTIFAGNMRYRAAQHLGWKTIPAVLVDIPEQLAKERAMRDNAQWGEWQDDDLAELIYGLGEEDSDLTLLGFDQAELDRLMAVTGIGETADVPIPEQWSILIDCRDEMHQTELLTRFDDEGLTCKALIS